MAAVLAYAGWWITGLLFWWVEQRDGFVRFHAAQSVVAFGLATLMIVGFGGMALVSLTVLPSAFVLFMWAAGLTWVLATVLCAVAIWMAVTGREWQMPVAGPLAARLAGTPR